MLSNSDTPLIRKLYAEFRIHCVSARRMINSNGDKRGPVSEVVVLNYGPYTSRRPVSRAK
jgi:DNA adenine methylase